MPLRLQSTWTEDGSFDGAIEQKFWVIRTLGDFTEADCIELKAIDRARIQMIMFPLRATALRRWPHSSAGGFGAPSTGRKM